MDLKLFSKTGWIVHAPIVLTYIFNVKKNVLPQSKNEEHNITIIYFYVEIVENILCFFILTHALETFAARAFISLRHECLQYAYAPFVEALLHEFGALWSIDFHA